MEQAEWQTVIYNRIYFSYLWLSMQTHDFSLKGDDRDIYNLSVNCSREWTNNM